MAYSGIICTIALDPFYQQFLIHQFSQESDPVFAFPKGHDLSLRFQFYLTCRKYPQQKIKDDWAFKIEIPWMEHKTPFYYNQISPNFQKKFQTRIREFWRDVSHEMMGKWIRAGFTKEEVVQKIVEEFVFGVEDEERIRREYKRYRESERLRRYRARRKQLKNVK